jgi:hypothetical protein
MRYRRWNSGIREFNSTTTPFMRVMRQLDGAQTGLGTVFIEEDSKGCY